MLDRVNREKILELQRLSTVLINPTPASEEFTKYFFPSKLIDYMSSGTPTITYKIKGIPEEYFDYCYICDHDGALALKKIIIEVCEKSINESKLMGERARDFILSNKNPKSQVLKIYKILK